MVDYVMVPREPTEDMLTRGVWEITDGEPNRDDLADAYRAMLSAAPASPIPTSVANEGEREAFEAGWDARELKQTGLSAAGYADNSYDVNVAWSLYDRAPAIAALSPALDNTAVEEDLRLIETLAAGDFSTRHFANSLAGAVQRLRAALSTVQTEKAR